MEASERYKPKHNEEFKSAGIKIGSFWWSNAPLFYVFIQSAALRCWHANIWKMFYICFNLILFRTESNFEAELMKNEKIWKIWNEIWKISHFFRPQLWVLLSCSQLDCIGFYTLTYLVIQPLLLLSECRQQEEKNPSTIRIYLFGLVGPFIFCLGFVSAIEKNRGNERYFFLCLEAEKILERIWKCFENGNWVNSP